MVDLVYLFSKTTAKWNVGMLLGSHVANHICTVFAYLLSWKQGGLSVFAVNVPLFFGCTARQDENVSMKCYLQIHNGIRRLPIMKCRFTGLFFDVECIYGFVWWGVCKQSRWRHSVTVPHTRWRICVTMATLWQQQDGGCMLLWKRYGNNKMAAILHLQQYSHRLNFFSQAVLVSDFSSGHCWLPTLKCFMISCSLSRKALGWLLTWKVLLPTMLLFHIMLFDALT